jgi:hypothetical protein
VPLLLAFAKRSYAGEFSSSTTCFPSTSPTTILETSYLDKLNKHHLTRNLVDHLERLGYTVALSLQRRLHRW